MTNLGLHIRSTFVEAASDPPLISTQVAVSRTVASTATEAGTPQYGQSAIDSFLDGRVDTIELSLSESLAAALSPARGSSATFLSAYFSLLKRTVAKAENIVVCVPESWRDPACIYPENVKRELEIGLNVSQPVFIGSGQAAGAFAIARARDSGVAIGSRLLIFEVSDSDCELSSFAVEPGDRLRPVDTRTFEGIGAFDRAMGRLLTTRRGGCELRNALLFARDRTRRQEALNLEWDLIADLPGTEVITSGGEEIFVEDVLMASSLIWTELDGALKGAIDSTSNGVQSDSIMFACIGRLASLPALRTIVDHSVSTSRVRRIDHVLADEEREYAVVKGALATASGEFDPRCYWGQAALEVTHQAASGAVERLFVSFDDPELGGCIASPLRLVPDAEPQPFEVRTGVRVRVKYGPKEGDVTTNVPPGAYFLGIRVDLAERAVLRLVDSVDAARSYYLPIE